MSEAVLRHQQTPTIIIIGDALPHYVYDDSPFAFERLTVDTLVANERIGCDDTSLVIWDATDVDDLYAAAQIVQERLHPSTILVVCEQDPPIEQAHIPLTGIEVQWWQKNDLSIEDITTAYMEAMYRAMQLAAHQRDCSHQLAEVFSRSVLSNDTQIYQELQAVGDVLEAEGVGVFISDGEYAVTLFGVNLKVARNFHATDYILDPDGVVAAACASQHPQTYTLAEIAGDHNIQDSLNVNSAAYLHIVPVEVAGVGQAVALIACDLPQHTLTALSPSLSVLAQRIATSVVQRTQKQHHERTELLLKMMRNLLGTPSVEAIQENLCQTIEQVPTVRQAIIWQRMPDDDTMRAYFCTSRSKTVTDVLHSIGQTDYFDGYVAQFETDTEPIYLRREKNIPQGIHALYDALRTELLVLVPLRSGASRHGLVMVAPLAENLLQADDVRFIGRLAATAGQTLGQWQPAQVLEHHSAVQEPEDPSPLPTAVAAPDKDMQLLRQLPMHISTYQARAEGLLRSLAAMGTYGQDIRQAHILNSALEELQVMGSLANDTLKVLALRQEATAAANDSETAPLSLVALDELVEAALTQIGRSHDTSAFHVERLTATRAIKAEVLSPSNVLDAVERLLAFLVTESLAAEGTTISFSANRPFTDLRIAHQLSGSAYTQLEQAMYDDVINGAGSDGNLVNMLGLYLAREIIQQERGFITLNRNELVISLPLGASLPAKVNEVSNAKPQQANAVAPTTIHPVETIVICIGQSQIVRTAIDVLREAGYDLSVQRSMADSLWYLDQQNSCDLIIVDDNFRGEDALEFACSLRKRTNVPIVLMGDQENITRTDVLENGIDTYLTDPLERNVMLLEIKAMIRRNPQIQDEPIRVGGLEIDLLRYTVTIKGEPIELTRLEYKLLRVLAINAGQVLEYEQLLRQVWGPEYINDKQHLWVFISRLRKKLEAIDDEHRYIHTRSGVGYVLR